MISLVIESESTRVCACEDLSTHLMPGSLAVKLESIAEILRAIRQTANAVVPDDSPLRTAADPNHLELAVQQLAGAVTAARTLAEAAPADDPNAAAVLQAIATLYLPDPAPAPPSVAVDPADAPPAGTADPAAGDASP